MITFSHKGDFKKTERFFTKAQQMNLRGIFDRYGSAGIAALTKATPYKTGLTSRSWDYTVEVTNWGFSITWFNENVVNGTPIAILIQYGHGTGTGGYVPGRDYINPAIRPIFDQMAEDIWKEVCNL
jgi:hypothetical protein